MPLGTQLPARFQLPKSTAVFQLLSARACELSPKLQTAAAMVSVARRQRVERLFGIPSSQGEQTRCLCMLSRAPSMDTRARYGSLTLQSRMKGRQELFRPVREQQRLLRRPPRRATSATAARAMTVAVAGSG